MICPNCGRTPAFVLGGYQYRESGLDNVMLNNAGMFRCSCGEEYIQLPGMAEVHDQIALSLLRKKSLLKGNEVRFLRKWLRLTSEDMALLFGVNRVSVSRWENRGITPAMDRAVRLFVADTRRLRLEVKTLFENIAPKPEKSFTIVIDLRSLPVAVDVLPAGRATMLRAGEFVEKVTAVPIQQKNLSDELALVA